MENIKEYVSRKKESIRQELEAINHTITIAVVQVGDNQASNAYVRGKLKDCSEVGIDCRLIKMPENASQDQLINLIHELNSDDSIEGFIVQLPLPEHINTEKIVGSIDFRKDIDGFTKNSLVNPATPQGILTYLEDNDFEFEDSNAVVIGRSNIVGLPMARLLTEKNCNVTVLHSKTSGLEKRFHVRHANLIVVATGHRNTIVDSDLIWREYYGDDHEYYDEITNDSCFIIDVGINRDDNWKLCGDCEDITVCEKTPVPGGVGLLTRLALIENIIKLYKIKKEI